MIHYLIELLWIVIGLILLVVFIFIFYNIQDKKLLETVTKSTRGTKTERDLVLKLLKHGIPPSVIFHDLYLKRTSGDFSQIDLVVVTNTGLIVFEVKDFSGWIFGRGNETHWTKVLAFGKVKHQIYNPIMQNEGHIRSLKKRLSQFDIPFYSVVVFYGNCSLKNITFVPDDAFLVKPKRVLEVMRLIAKNVGSLPDANRNEVIKVLKEGVLNGENGEVQTLHVENIAGMLGKNRIFD